jgi:hypothetical protein
VPARDPRLQILIIRSWIEELRPIRDALRAGGLSVDLTSVDFEAALDAALSRGGFAAVIYDPATPALPRDLVIACMRANKCELPIIVLEDVASLAARVQTAIAAHKN